MRAFVHVRRRGVTGENLVPLMNQIARNMLIDRHRRGGPTIVALDDAAEAVTDPAPDPTEVVVSLEARKAVRDAVDSLPHRHRDAILYALAGMTPAQVAAQMGIGRNAADALLHRARRSLKDRLRAVGEGTFGLVALVGFRIREATRKAGVRAGIVDPSAAGTLQGGIGAAAAALVVALNFGAMPATASAGGSFAGGKLAAAPAVLAGAGARGAAIAGPGAGGAAGNVTSINGGLVGARSQGDLVNPGSETTFKIADPEDPQHQTIAGVDYAVYDDGQHSGPVGPQEDAASQAICGTSPESCDAVRKGLGGP